jgi:NAD-dependent SIR2 family protein deacetylase
MALNNADIFATLKWLSEEDMLPTTVGDTEEVMAGVEMEHEYDTPKQIAKEHQYGHKFMFLVGAGASKEVGIPTFSELDLNKGAVPRKLHEVLMAAWDHYGMKTRVAMLKKVRYTGDEAKEYFLETAFTDKKNVVRRLLTSTANEVYPELVSLVWQFLYGATAGRYPGKMHKLMRRIQDNGALTSVITMNIDGLEIAAGITPETVFLAHGNAMMGTSDGKEVLPVRDVAGITPRMRPVIVFYDEENLLTIGDSLRIAPDADTTLVIVGTAGKVGINYLINMRPKSVIVINPSFPDVSMVMDELSEEGMHFGQDGMTMYGLPSAAAFEEFMERAFAEWIKTDPEMLPNNDPRVVDAIRRRLQQEIDQISAP